MKCDRIGEDLGAYLDGELDSARRSELDGHLASCEACAAELERLRKLSRLVADVPRAAAPAGLAARILSAASAGAARAEPSVAAAPVSAARAEPDVPAAPEPRPRVLHLSRWSGGLAAVAAVLLVGVVSIVALRERDERDAADRVAETLDGGPAGTPAAGEDTDAAPEEKKLEDPAVIERSRIARKGWTPEKRRDAVLKKGIASRPADAAAASGSRAARAHGKVASPPAENAVAARAPAAPKPVIRRRKGKADAFPSAPPGPMEGRRVVSKETRAKAGQGGRAAAGPAAAAGPGEQAQVAVPAPRAEAGEFDRPRGRTVDQLRDGNLREGLASGRGEEAKDRASEALLAKAAKAKAPARKIGKAYGEPVIRLQLRAGSPSNELARIIAAAERFGGGVSGRYGQEAVREQAARPPGRDGGAAAQTATRRPGVVRVRIPRDRADEFLASVEGLTLPEAGGAPAGRRARTRTRPGKAPAAEDESKLNAARSQTVRAEPSRTRPPETQAAKLEQMPTRWVLVEIVVHTPPARAAEAEAARRAE